MQWEGIREDGRDGERWGEMGGDMAERLGPRVRWRDGGKRNDEWFNGLGGLKTGSQGSRVSESQ